jgi:NADP-dependent 3-hydroxy acid dehydrogenase YdfG
MSADRAQPGRTVLVTGAASGIGRATARLLAAQGWRVMIVDRDEAGAARTAREIERDGGIALHRRVDVTRDDEVAAAVDAVVEAWGRLDGAFNNAGIQDDEARLLEVPEDVFDRTMDVNVKGVWRCLRAEVRAMLAQGGGAIVNTASVAGLVGAPRLAAYAASKHAVVGAHALGRAGVREPRAARERGVPGRDRHAMADARDGARPAVCRAAIDRMHRSAARPARRGGGHGRLAAVGRGVVRDRPMAIAVDGGSPPAEAARGLTSPRRSAPPRTAASRSAGSRRPRRAGRRRSRAGQVSVALPPTFIRCTPSVQHGITRFSGNTAGWPRLCELSNSRPSASVPR